jgi:hypothetical protein
MNVYATKESKDITKEMSPIEPQYTVQSSCQWTSDVAPSLWFCFSQTKMKVAAGVDSLHHKFIVIHELYMVLLL